VVMTVARKAVRGSVAKIIADQKPVCLPYSARPVRNTNQVARVKSTGGKLRRQASPCPQSSLVVRISQASSGGFEK
jgi:hypothetical protein